jgi:hypothetical protein
VSLAAESTPFVWRPFSEICELFNNSGQEVRRCSDKTFLATASAVGHDAAMTRCWSTCAPYSMGRWCQAMGKRCRWPQMSAIVEVDTGVLPRPFHMRRDEDDPMKRCVRTIDKAGPLRVVFVGDSQTKMMMFEWERWLDGGAQEPIWSMTEDATMAAIMKEHGWGLSTHLSPVKGMYEHSTKGFEDPLVYLNSTIKMFEALGHHAATQGGARNGTRLVAVLGWGTWDAIFSKEKDVFGTFFAGQKRYLDAIFQAVAACDGCWGNVHVFLRNSWTSLDKQASTRRNSTNGNDLARHTDLLQAINRRNPSVVAHYQACYPTWKFHEVDVWGLSWPRRDEMPYDGDGLHWACISKGKQVSTCRSQIGAKRAPDEVAIASLQVLTNQLCDDFSLN